MMTDDGTTIRLTLGNVTFTATGATAERCRRRQARLNQIRDEHFRKLAIRNASGNQPGK